jgi:glucokinase
VTDTLRGGIDLGGTKIQAVVVDADNNVVGSARRATPVSGGPSDVVAELAKTLQEAATQAGAAEPGALQGVGVGSPGTIDHATGSVSSARNLPDWESSFPLAQTLSQLLGGARVAVGNDVQVAVEAEDRLGAGKDYNSMLGVWWGTGVGGGLVMEGKPWLGRGAAGEIGHTVVKVGGARCGCGRRGCMEAYAGRASMERYARRQAEHGEHTKLFELMEKHGRDRLTSGIWARALDRDDELAHRTVQRALRALGAGIASAVNLLDVETVVIGGGLGTRMGEDYVKLIAERMQPHLFVDTRPPVIQVAALGDLGGAIGAALLVS